MSLTEEDVKRIIADQSQARTMTGDTVQWLVRSAYEEGWRAAGGDTTRSPHTESPKGWRLAWLASTVRDTLVRNGMISGKDSYK